MAQKGERLARAMAERRPEGHPLPASFLAFVAELGVFDSASLIGEQTVLSLEWLASAHSGAVEATELHLPGATQRVAGFQIVDDPGDAPSHSFAALEGYETDTGEALWVYIGHDAAHPDGIAIAPMGYRFDEVALAALLGLTRALFLPSKQASAAAKRLSSLRPEHREVADDLLRTMEAIEHFRRPALIRRIRQARQALSASPSPPARRTSRSHTAGAKPPSTASDTERARSKKLLKEWTRSNPDPVALRAIIDQGVDVDVPLDGQKTKALHHAASQWHCSGSEETIAILANAGADFSALARGSTALEMCVWGARAPTSKNRERWAQMIRALATRTPFDSGELPPMIRAARMKTADRLLVIDALLEAGQPADQSDGQTTALIEAARAGDEAVVGKLLFAGADAGLVPDGGLVNARGMARLVESKALIRQLGAEPLPGRGPFDLVFTISEWPELHRAAPARHSEALAALSFDARMRRGRAKSPHVEALPSETSARVTEAARKLLLGSRFDRLWTDLLRLAPAAKNVKRPAFELVISRAPPDVLMTAVRADGGRPIRLAELRC
ncbi:MAG: hypothetical protein KC619_01460 [Myxococcales bacterium]|nr:hypothetical protein [Myxococcales bacterium]